MKLMIIKCSCSRIVENRHGIKRCFCYILWICPESRKFIYTISSKGALKGLRARSFYLEILMEHIIDETLSALTLSRSSLIYSGGGHCYMLLPNTDRVKEILKKQQEQINHWFIDKFDTALYPCMWVCRM